MKGIIPAAGLGTRLRPAHLYPAQAGAEGRRQTDYHSRHRNAAAAGIHEIAIIVSDLTRTEIEYTLRDLSGRT